MQSRRDGCRSGCLRKLRGHRPPGTARRRPRGRAGRLADLLAHHVPAGPNRRLIATESLVHHRLQRVHRGPECWARPHSEYTADLCDVLLHARRRTVGTNSLRFNLYTIPLWCFPHRPAADDLCLVAGAGRGEVTGVSSDPVSNADGDRDPHPPFPGQRGSRWVRAGAGAGPGRGDISARTSPGGADGPGPPPRSAGRRAPLVAIDEEGGDVTRIAPLDGSPLSGNAALGAWMTRR